jgi:hypothetical protein
MEEREWKVSRLKSTAREATLRRHSGSQSTCGRFRQDAKQPSPRLEIEASKTKERKPLRAKTHEPRVTQGFGEFGGQRIMPSKIWEIAKLSCEFAFEKYVQHSKAF